MKLCIAIPTFRRPSLLCSLLLALKDHTRLFPGTQVLVVDNDAQGAAKTVVDQIGSEYGEALHYRVIPERGVSAARNGALDFASAFDFLAMIDDDELPTRVWLTELLRIQADTRADAVIGPVISSLPADAPLWAKKGRFFEHDFGVPDGSEIMDGHTGNCLLSMPAITSRGLRFNTRFNTSGGEDTFFFRQLRAEGGRLAYAAGAVAIESVPEARIRPYYVLRRSMRCGITMSFCDRMIRGTTGALVLRTGKAFGNLVFGTAVLVPLTLWRGKAGIIEALRRITRGLGMLVGLMSIGINEYGQGNVAGPASATPGGDR
jgi:succinoglycan biosynthesis protein ExoM